MSEKILSETIIIDKTDDSAEIERVLSQKYGEIIRWAIVKVTDQKLSVSFAYKKG